MVGLKLPDLLCRHFIVSDDFYFRIDLSDELLEVIGKTVIIVDQQNHTDPSSHSIIIHIQERLAFLLRRAYVRSTFLTVGLRSALYSEES